MANPELLARESRDFSLPQGSYPPSVGSDEMKTLLKTLGEQRITAAHAKSPPQAATDGVHALGAQYRRASPVEVIIIEVQVDFLRLKRGLEVGCGLTTLLTVSPRPRLMLLFSSYVFPKAASPLLLATCTQLAQWIYLRELPRRRFSFRGRNAGVTTHRRHSERRCHL